MINRQDRLLYFSTETVYYHVCTQYTKFYITRWGLTRKMCVHVNPTVKTNIVVETETNY